MQLSFSLKIILTMGLIIPGVLGAAYLIEQTNVRTEQQQEAVEHTHHVIEVAKLLLSVMKDAETGKRGFVITGEEDYLEPFLSAHQQIGDIVNQFEQLTGGHDQQQLDRIKQLVDEKFAELEQAIDARRHHGFDAALRLVQNGSGKQIMDTLRRTVGAMIVEEQTVLMQRKAIFLRDNVQSHQILIWSAVGLALLILMLTMLVLRNAVGPIRQLSSKARKMASGDYSVRITVKNKDEIGQLAEEFNRMASSIQSHAGKLESVLATLTDGLIVIDARGCIESYNKAAEHIFGYSPEEVLGNNVKMLMPEPYRSEHDGYLQHYHETGEKRVIGIGREVTGRRKSGKTFPMDLSVNPVVLQSSTIYVGLVRDISERKKNERVLEAAMRAAESSNRMKSEFLANMSHELRTPLNAIIGYSELLSEEAEDNGDTENIADLNKIHSAGNHLLSLINDVLDLAKIEAGRVELMPEQVDVHALASDVVSVTQPLLEKNANQFELDCPADIGEAMLDAGRVRQVLMNLLSNAAKFTKQGTISMTVRREDQLLRFAVSDSGIGMTPAQLEKVFIRFVQADASTTREYGGTGLGLPISEEMCRLMGGSIEASSETGKGSTFTVVIPADVSVAVERVRSSESAAAMNHDTYCSGAGMHAGEYVLIIDDDQSDRDMLSRHLEKAGFGVTAVSSGQQGLTLAQEKAPLVILLDVLMPEIDGWQVLEALKQDPATVDIPVVMISVIDKQSQAACMGAVDYLSKPLDKHQLLSTMNKLMPEAKQADVLVIEDDDAMRELVCRQLASVGWQSREACQGKEGLAQIEVKMPDLILLDLMMPEMYGFTFLTALRKLPAGRNTPVVVLTAKDLSIKEQQFLLGAAQQVIGKGDDGSGLDQLLQNVRHQIMLSRDAARSKTIHKNRTGDNDEKNSIG